jgi:hypothetical protein
LSGDDSSDCPLLNRFSDKIVPVKPLAFQGDKQVALPNSPAIGADTQDDFVA